MKNSFILVLILSVFIASSSYAQNKKRSKKIELSGFITDSLDNPIPNVNVFVDGKQAEVSSNEDGQFRLKLKPKTQSISVFSLVNGFEKKEYHGEAELTFILSGDNSVHQHPLNVVEEPTRDEIINVGYSLERKRNNSYSIGSVDKKVIDRAAEYSSIYAMIKGQVIGVSVNGSTIRIRGSKDPLLIVDGFIVDNLFNIAPSSVKSISVLKGPSTAIYGVRGAHGVLLIELKSAGDYDY